MSVQTQINRIKAARDSIAAKIRAKGVTVPTTAKIEDLPDYVESISTSEDLSTELTEQANLIAQQQTLISNLETALENKAGGSGGASIETKTVTVSGYSNLNYINATTFVDGQIVTVQGSKTATIENAVVGSVFEVSARTSNGISLTNASVLYSIQTSIGTVYVFICKVT